MSMASHQLKVIINSTLNVGAALAKLKAQIKVAATQFDAMANVRHVTLIISDETATVTFQYSQPIPGLRNTQNKISECSEWLVHALLYSISKYLHFKLHCTS